MIKTVPFKSVLFNRVFTVAVQLKNSNLLFICVCDFLELKLSVFTHVGGVYITDSLPDQSNLLI